MARARLGEEKHTKIMNSESKQSSRLKKVYFIVLLTWKNVVKHFSLTFSEIESL